MIRDSRQPVEAHFRVVSDFPRKIYDSPSAHPRESVALRRFHESHRRTRIFAPSSALRRTPNPLPSQGCCWRVLKNGAIWSRLGALPTL